MTTLTEWAHKHGVTGAALRELIEILEPVSDYTPDAVNYQSEAAVQAQIILEAPKHGASLWRNNNGACVDDTGRQIRYGLGNVSKKLNKVWKSSDLIGITPRMVMPQHIGQVWGLFTAVEVKEPGWHLTPGDARAVAQMAFGNNVRKLGGLFTFAPSVINYTKIITDGV